MNRRIDEWIIRDTRDTLDKAGRTPQPLCQPSKHTELKIPREVICLKLQEGTSRRITSCNPCGPRNTLTCLTGCDNFWISG